MNSIITSYTNFLYGFHNNTSLWYPVSGGDHGHSHGGGHGHSHGGHGHSHGGSNEQIFKGVYLHILADTLGSVGVIVSALLMQYFGWMIADPICSMIIAILIFISVGSLLKESTAILMQRQPKELDHKLPECYNKVCIIFNLFETIYLKPWQNKKGQTFVVSCLQKSWPMKRNCKIDTFLEPNKGLALLILSGF